MARTSAEARYAFRLAQCLNLLGGYDKALQSDIRIVPSPPLIHLSLASLECVANISGCVLADIAFQAYYNYQWRAQDHAARLEMMDDAASRHRVFAYVLQPRLDLGLVAG